MALTIAVLNNLKTYEIYNLWLNCLPSGLAVSRQIRQFIKNQYNQISVIYEK